VGGVIFHFFHLSATSTHFIHIVIFVGYSRLELSKEGGCTWTSATLRVHTYDTYIHTFIYIIIIIRQPKYTEDQQLVLRILSCVQIKVKMDCGVLHRTSFVHQTSIRVWKLETPLYEGEEAFLSLGVCIHE